MIKTIDLDAANEKVNANLFEPLSYNHIPKLFIGYVIKNQLEFSILKCNDDVVDIAHFCGINGNIEPIFLRGMYCEMNPLTERIHEKIYQLQSLDVQLIFNEYIKLLCQFDLSCNNTYAYLMDGLYPIDIIHLEKITSESYTLFENKILNKKSIPWFFKPELKIFILTKSNTYINKNI